MPDPIDNRVSLQQLEIFSRVVQVRSVTKVAEERRVAQPAITGQLRSLERRVGAKLIYWDGREMQLTEAGQVALDWANALLERTREASRTVAGTGSGGHGAVVVGASLSLGNYHLPPLLVEFQQQRPGLLVTLRIADPLGTVSDLSDGHFDFAVVGLDVPPPSDRVVWTRCGSDRLTVIGAPHRAGDRACGSVAELAALPFVCSAAGQTTRRVIDQQFRERGVADRNIVMECSHPESIKSVVRTGSAVALVSRRAVVDELSAGSIVELTVPTAPFEMPIFVGHRAHRQFSPTQDDLFTFITGALRNGR